jgi:arsenate reductase
LQKPPDRGLFVALDRPRGAASSWPGAASARSRRGDGGVTDVLFICVANSGRSVMAERIFNLRARGRHRARSAGSDPGAAVHPVVLDALREVGIDASDHVPRALDPDEVAAVDAVVSTCGEEACPVTPPGIRRIYWNLRDPKGLQLEEVRSIREEIVRRVEDLIRQLDAAA